MSEKHESLKARFEDDEKWMKEVEKIDNPYVMLSTLLENEWMLGYDAYYAESRTCMLSQAEKIVKDYEAKTLK